MANNEDEATQTPAYSDLALTIAALMTAPGNARAIEKIFTNAFVDGIKTIIATAIPLGVGIIAPIAEGIAKGEELAAPAFARLNALAVSDLFGVNISESTFAGQGTGGRIRADMAIGEGILRALAAPGGALQPDDGPAKKYLSTMVGFSLEGWLEGWMFQAASQLFSLGQVNLDKFAELDDILANALGLGRLSRRIIGPYIDALVVTPLEWKVNKTYTPRLLSASEAARQYYRGRWTIEQVKEELGRQGYSADRVEALLNGARKTISAGDVLYLQRDGGLVRGAAETMLKEMGYDAETIALLFLAEDTRRYRGVLEQTATVAMGAYVDGTMTAAEFGEVLSVVYPQQEERDLFLDLARVKRIAARKRLSKGDVEEAVKRNILSMIDYRRWAEAEGYGPDEVSTLELLLRAEIGDAAEQARRKAEIETQREEERQRRAADAERRRVELEARRAASVPPIADIKRAVVLRIVPMDRYVDQLRALRYPAGDIAFLTEMLQADVDAQLDREEAGAAAVATRAGTDLSLGTLERAVIAGLMPAGDYGAILRDRGFDDGEVRILVDLAVQRREARAVAEETRGTRAGDVGARGLTLAQAERATKRGVWSLAEFASWLQASGFDAFTAGVLVELMRRDLAELAEAEARRAAIEQELAPRNLSLAQIEAAVLRGLRTIDDYRRVLSLQRYSIIDQQLLVDLLTAKLADQAAAAELRAAVAASTDDRRVSLAQIQRAVTLGSVSLDAYRAWLEDAGYGDLDVEILIDALVRDVQAARTDEGAREQIIDELGARGADVVALERRVLDSTETLGAYVALLQSLGLAPDDVERLARLLSERLDDHRDALALAARVDDDLRPKQMSLSQWAAAVREDLRTLTDYAAFLQTQGYALADVQILTTLLHREIERAAAKSAQGGIDA